MMNYHEIPTIVSSARATAEEFTGELLTDQNTTLNPVDSPRWYAEHKLHSVWSTVGSLTAVHTDCIAFTDSQLDGETLFEVCRDLEMSREALENARDDPDADADRIEEVAYGVELADAQVEMYANLLDLGTRTRLIPCYSGYLTYPRRCFNTGEAERMMTAIEAARRALDVIEEYDSRNVTPYFPVQLDDVVAECTVIADLDLREDAHIVKVTVSSDTHHVGVTESALAPNRRTYFVKWLLRRIKGIPVTKLIPDVDVS